LASLEERDLSTIENEIAAIEKAKKEAEVARLKAEREALAAKEEAERKAEEAKQRAKMADKVRNGEIDIYSIYGDSIIFGDSRAQGFSWSGVLDSRNVCAVASNTIRNMPDFYGQVTEVNPSVIFINYGMNDMGIGYWDDVYQWCDELAVRIAEVKSLAPNAEIYVVSLFPVIDPAFEKSELWYHIDEWNAEVQNHCKEWGIPFIDMTSFVNAHQDLYEYDGIHFLPEFYPLWANEMIARMYLCEKG